MRGARFETLFLQNNATILEAHLPGAACLLPYFEEELERIVHSKA
jgi:hypothetical protein